MYRRSLGQFVRKKDILLIELSIYITWILLVTMYYEDVLI